MMQIDQTSLLAAPVHGSLKGFDSTADVSFGAQNESQHALLVQTQAGQKTASTPDLNISICGCCAIQQYQDKVRCLVT